MSHPAIVFGALIATSLFAIAMPIVALSAICSSIC